MSNSTTMKEVAHVKIGPYQVTLDAEKMALLHELCNDNGRELRQIQEMTDWLLDLCCNLTPDEGECLKYMKYLKNLRGAFDYMRSIGVEKVDGNA